MTEEQIPPEERLGICLPLLGRGGYYYTIAEMVGRGVATVSSILLEVCQVLVEYLWTGRISSNMPKSQEDLERKILDMEELWQFPCCWVALNGCHVPIKCPPGGPETCREYHNFKNFYSVVLMAMVDSHYRFVWSSCGYPGNSHDAIILRSTNLWNSIQDGLLPNMAKVVGEVNVSPLIIAFPLRTWLMNSYKNAVLNPQQRYFIYRLSRGSMVTEEAYGQLKGTWRLLLRKKKTNESDKEHVRTATLACMVLHNVCLMQRDSIPRKLDLKVEK